MLVTIGIALSSWTLYAVSISSFYIDGFSRGTQIITFSIVLPNIISGTCFLIIFHLMNVMKRMDDQNYIRQSVGKKLMPLHLLLQLSLVIG